MAGTSNNKSDDKQTNSGSQGGTHEQHVEAGKKGGAASHGSQAEQSHDSDTQQGSGTRGGSHEKQSDSASKSDKSHGSQADQSQDDDSKQSSGSQGGTHEQHVKAGQQSHKNSYLLPTQLNKTICRRRL